MVCVVSPFQHVEKVTENNSRIWTELIALRPVSEWKFASFSEPQSTRNKHTAEKFPDKSATNMSATDEGSL